MAKAGVREAEQAQQRFDQWLSQFMGQAYPRLDVATAKLMQFLSSQGEFLDSALGLSGITRLLAELEGFRANQLPTMTGAGLPPELQQILTRFAGGMDAAEDAIQHQGRTAQSEAVREQLTAILTGVTGDQVSARNAAEQILSTQGMTSGLQSLQQAAKGLMLNQGFTAPLTEMEKIGSALLSTGGQTKETQAAIREAMNLIQAGGQSPETRALFGQGQGLVSAGGMTPQMSQLMSQIQAGISGGGMTPEARQIFDEAMQIVQARGQGGALLPMEQMTSFARDAAATAMAQRAEAARRSALQRTGGAVAAGTAEQALAEFADEAARAEAEAVREAATTQQGLQLQQLLGAMGVGADISRAASALLGEYLGAGTEVTRAASANLATGAGMMTSAEDIASRRLGLGFEGLTAAQRTEIERMLAGGNFVEAANKLAQARMQAGMTTGLGVEAQAGANRATALDTLLGLVQQQTAAGGQLTNLLGTEFEREAAARQGLLGLGGASADIFQKERALELGSFLQSIGLSADVANSYVNQLLGATSQLAGIGGQFTGMAPSIFSGFGGVSQSLIQAAMQPGFWEKLALAGVGGLAGGVSSGFGEWLTKGGKG